MFWKYQFSTILTISSIVYKVWITESLSEILFVSKKLEERCRDQNNFWTILHTNKTMETVNGNRYMLKSDNYIYLQMRERWPKINRFQQSEMSYYTPNDTAQFLQ